MTYSEDDIIEIEGVVCVQNLGERQMLKLMRKVISFFVVGWCWWKICVLRNIRKWKQLIIFMV